MRRLRVYITKSYDKSGSRCYVCDVLTCIGTEYEVLIEPHYYSEQRYERSNFHIIDYSRDICYLVNINSLIMPGKGRLTIENGFLQYRDNNVCIDMRYCKI